MKWVCPETVSLNCPSICGVSKKKKYPQILHGLIGFFRIIYKPSILGVFSHHWRKPSIRFLVKPNSDHPLQVIVLPSWRMCTSSRSIILSAWAWVSAVGFSRGGWWWGLIDHLLLSLKKAAIFMDDFFGMAFRGQSSFMSQSSYLLVLARQFSLGWFRKLQEIRDLRI